MFSVFLDPGSLPFSVALTVVAALFALELISSLIGLSFMGAGAEGADMDFDVDADFDLTTGVDIDLDAPDVDMAADLEAGDAAEVGPSAMLGWLGMRGVPFLIWFVSLLTLFGLSGLILQGTLAALFGKGVSPLAASALALLPALAGTRVLSNWVALLMPKTETTALRARHLGGYSGVITQGVAARGRPAEAKIKDRHGNTHYLRVEPLEEDASFAQGSDVTIIRKRGDKFFVI
ncbi:YqiJ family protein [Shimia sp. R11_0]|uniref:YqiJ family protein n=1 Tax=Shimia sp. R11_0 TaxID=2821096 RepID=UPI001ADACADB|nr:YqiJ family protein [Shimia sp. R11_0]MBO9478565.1 YqiJ family protein [Shimia sp. R11_0]